MNHNNKPVAAIDKQAARQSFNKAANTYDQVAVLQREVGSRLLDRMNLMRLIPNTIVDIGCGTGDMTLKLLHAYKQAHVI
jgi:malonyl-CoA O-methyltransferase